MIDLTRLKGVLGFWGFGVLSVFIENQVPGSPKSPVIWC